MQIPFQTIHWDAIPETEHPGETGTSFWKTVPFEGLRIREVTYSKGYFANHWCAKGHVVYCLEGEFVSELESGEKLALAKGMGYGSRMMRVRTVRFPKAA